MTEDIKKTNLKKTRVGIVVSDKMDKTVIVTIERRFQEKVFKKFIRQKTKFKVHDEKNECRVGDEVEIVETRPLSREKRWRVQKILKREK